MDGDCKNTGVRTVFWQFTDNLTLVHTGKSWYRTIMLPMIQDRRVKMITRQITVLGRLGRKLRHLSRRQKLEDVNWEWDTSLAGRVLEGCELRDVKHLTILSYLVGIQYGDTITLTTVTVGVPMTGKVIHRNGLMNRNIPSPQIYQEDNSVPEK